MRLMIPAFLSFIMVLITIFLTDPVINEGWLRSLFISLLLSTQSSFAFLFIGCLAVNKVQGLALSKLYGIFLVAVPLGLLLHHPWNYFAFFSPLYWISWAWVSYSPSESLLYGAIAIIITLGTTNDLNWFLKSFRPESTLLQSVTSEDEYIIIATIKNRITGSPG